MNKNNTKYNTGAAMMLFVIFLVFGSITVIVGIVTPVMREFQIAKSSLESKSTYFLAESGVEDALYRIKNSKQIGASETIVLGTTSTTTTITTLSGGQKEITSLGDTNSYQRKVDMIISSGVGVSFNYGVQVGQGGVVLTGSGTVNGNVFANGPITGDSSAVITGTAISANSPGITSDQSNGTPPTAYDVKFGDTTATQDVAQSFKVSVDNPINKVQLYIKKVSTPADATVKIVNDNGGVPGTTVLATGTLLSASVGTTSSWIDVSFTSNPLLTATTTTYWVIIDSAVNASKYYVLGANANGYADGIGKIGTLGGTWNNTTPSGLDYFFNIFIGGVNGLIAGSSGSQWNQLHVGTVSGSAQAHTVNYTNATGLIYCASGTGNNKTCTAQPDPTYIAEPISDANIAQWKADALAGGTNSGDYSVGWAGGTIGPKKISGSLTVSGGGTLVVTGTLWVTGEVTLNGGGKIVLSPSYGAGDGVIVADGKLEINGGGSATGSGTAGSYIMILSTKTGSAASVDGGAGAVVVATPNGTLNITGGASLKEATGYQMTIGGGSSVTYESGLANLNFSSGPSGSYTISSWKETQ